MAGNSAILENQTLFSENPSPETAPPNELPTSPDSQAQATIIERVVAAGKGVFEKHGVVFKRTGGRPRKDGLPNKGDIPLNAPSTALPEGASPAPSAGAPPLDPALMRRCCSAVLKGVSAFLDKTLYRKALTKTGDSRAANDLVAATAITKEEVDSFAELAEICLRKYGVGTEYAPEIGLAAIAAGIGLRYAVALKALETKP